MVNEAVLRNQDIYVEIIANFRVDIFPRSV
jgi:hypothetical protein